MATIPQIQRGFTRFVDMHLAGAFDGWQKAIVVGGATLLSINMPNLVKMYGQHPLVAALGVYRPETESVDIDTLYNAFVPHLGGDKIPVVVPKVGVIKIGKDEIDLIVKYIKEA
jgi:hypothetical protein